MVLNSEKNCRPCEKSFVPTFRITLLIIRESLQKFASNLAKSCLIFNILFKLKACQRIRESNLKLVEIIFWNDFLKRLVYQVLMRWPCWIKTVYFPARRIWRCFKIHKSFSFIPSQSWLKFLYSSKVKQKLNLWMYQWIIMNHLGFLWKF